MVKVPAGPFKFGSDHKTDKEADVNELSIRDVEVEEFAISVTPITNAQYEVFIHESHYPPPAHWSKLKGLPKNLRLRPVTYVSQVDAFEYCKWLSEKTTQSFCLPNEIEWEKAARGTDGRKYPWGNNWNPLLSNCGETELIDVTDVGLCIANASPYGALDMAGNIFEWTDEASYSVSTMNLLGSDFSCISKLRLKGCGTGVGRKWARCASAMEVDPNGLPITPDLKEGDLGFRVIERTGRM